MKYRICGTEFEATEEAAGAFNAFLRGHPQATDLSSDGMIEELEAFARRTQNCRRLVDAGALFGLFSLVFTARPETKAWAFEPSPWAFPVLQEQCRLNPQRDITPMNLFLGRELGRTAYCGRDWMHVAHEYYPPGCERLTFEETTLDHHLGLAPDCIKIDVEGKEASVLRGAYETLKRYRPLIFLEAHGGTLYLDRESPDTLTCVLLESGYRIESLQGRPYPAALLERRGSIARVVCVPEEKYCP